MLACNRNADRDCNHASCRLHLPLVHRRFWQLVQGHKQMLQEHDSRGNSRVFGLGKLEVQLPWSDSNLYSDTNAHAHSDRGRMLRL